MALAHYKYELTVSLADCGANVTTKRYWLRSAIIADAVTDSAIVIAALDAITNAVIVSYRICDVFYEGSVVYPAAGIKNSDKASITSLLDTGGGKKANFQVPAPVIGLFKDATGPGADEIDVLDADLVTYANLFASDGECFISDSEDLDVMLSGLRISAKKQHG